MADTPQRAKAARDKVHRHRARLREQGLRPLQIWVPDTRAPGFAEEVRRQSLLVAESAHDEADQAFIDAISEIDIR